MSTLASLHVWADIYMSQWPLMARAKRLLGVRRLRLTGNYQVLYILLADG